MIPVVDAKQKSGERSPHRGVLVRSVLHGQPTRSRSPSEIHARAERARAVIGVEQWRAEQEVIKIILGTQRTRDWWDNVTSGTFHKDFVVVVRELTNDQPESEFVESVLSIE